MNYTLIVVADSTRCRFFSLKKNHGPLKEINDLIHESARLPNQELTNAAAGTQPNTKTSVTSRTHTLEPKLPHKKQQAILFSQEICDYLIEQNKNPHLINIILIAPPKFLGFLNQSILAHKELKNKIVKEITKNLITASINEIKEHLPFSIPGHLQ